MLSSIILAPAEEALATVAVTLAGDRSLSLCSIELEDRSSVRTVSPLEVGGVNPLAMMVQILS